MKWPRRRRQRNRNSFPSCGTTVSGMTCGTASISISGSTAFMKPYEPTVRCRLDKLELYDSDDTEYRFVTIGGKPMLVRKDSAEYKKWKCAEEL